MRSLLPLVLVTLLLAACGDSDPSPVTQAPGATPPPATPPPTTPPPTTPPPTTPPPNPPAPAGAWYAGDLHVHNDHSSDGSAPRQCCDDRGPGNSPIRDQVLFANLMGLDWVPMTDHRTYDQHYDPTWESADLLLMRGEEANGSPHATVHGAIDTIVQGANPPGQPEFLNLQQSIWDAHAQGAVWVTAHPDDGEVEDDGVTPNMRANAVGVDLVETWNRGSLPDVEIAYAENRWNAGWRFGMAGASDNHFKELWALQGPGMPATEVFASALTERALLDGLRAGRTTIHTDALLAPTVTMEADFQGDDVFEAIGGDEVFVPAGTAGRLRVRAQGASGNTLRIYKSPGVPDGPFAEFAIALPEIDRIELVEVIAEAAPTWYRAEIRGLAPPAGLNTGDVPLSLIPEPQALPDQLRASASPIFVSTAPVSPQAAVPVPADSGTDDGAVLALGDAGTWTGFPDVAVAAGVTHIVAESHGPGATRVVYRRTGASPVILSGGSDRARFPRIAVRGDLVFATWQDATSEIPHRTGIVLARSADGGSTWTTTTLRTAEGRCEHPALAVTPAGEAVVAWQEIGAGVPFDVWVQVGDEPAQNVTGTGKTVQAANPVDARSSRYPASVWPALAVAADGRIALAWQDNRTDINPLWTGSILTGEANGTDPDNWQIMVATRAPGGSSWTPGASIGADDRADRHPALAFTGGGQLVAAWDTKELRSSGANLSVIAAVSGDGGATFGAPAPIAPLDAAMSQFVRLGTGADGRVRAAWYDSRSADWRWRVMTAVLGLSGWESVELIPSRGINTWPATSGGAIVFASTRNAARMQRDVTQQIFVR